jgi:hypothetical protein
MTAVPADTQSPEAPAGSVCSAASAGRVGWSARRSQGLRVGPGLWLARASGHYWRMLMARAITSAASASDPAASSIMRSLDHGLIADVSVGLNAMAVQKASDR